VASRPPLPPFTEETARQKVQMAEDAWNTRPRPRRYNLSLAPCQACTASTSSAAGWGTETSTAVPRFVVTSWYATGTPFRVTECTVALAASTVPMVRARPCAPVTSVR
jgi:nuclear transport factor 2 (NTF2) superfamily protein